MLSYNDAFLAISVIAVLSLACLIAYRLYENMQARRHSATMAG